MLFGGRVDIFSLEADLAFFEARLSLARDTEDTCYQRAQIKTYQTLGKLIGETLDTLRPQKPAQPKAPRRRKSAAKVKVTG